MASNIVATQINGEDITKGFNPILASYTVTGSAVTSIDFTGLDINAHGGSYEIELRIVNASGSSSLGLKMYINNDITDGNYFAQYLQGNTSTVATGAETGPIVAYLNIATTHLSNLSLSLINSLVRFTSISGYAPAVVQARSGGKTATVTNITQLTFISTTALAIGIGSQIIIRRKDK